MGRSGSISAGLGTSLAGLLKGCGTAAPPPALPPSAVGWRGVPAGAVGPVRHGVALRPVDGAPHEELTQKYL